MPSTSSTAVPPDSHMYSPTDEELGAFFCSLSQSGIKSAILSLVPPYCDDFIPSMEKGILPRPLTDLYDKKLFNVSSFSELSSICNNIATSVTLHVSPEQSKAVEEATRTQSQCKLWYSYRAGRITASNFRSAVHTNHSKPSLSLIKRICYPQNYKFKTQETQWGIDHEEMAIVSFSEQIHEKHSNFKINRCSFIINPQYSHLGASPDGITECNCCGKGVLEVKCPYQCKEYN